MKKTATFSLLFALLLMDYGVAQNPILNNSFEEWANGEPVHWFTRNISQTEKARDGMFAVTGVTVEEVIEGQIYIAGPSISNSNSNDIIGFAINEKPKYLNGYYIFEPIDDDDGYLSIGVYATRHIPGDGRTVVGTGGRLIANTMFLDSTYTFFSFPINYYFPEEPDSLYISVSINGSNYAGTRFYLDNLSVSTMELQTPEENDLIIAGQKYNITWNASSENINLWYSIDGGNTFEEIERNISGSQAMYEWEVPDSLLSARAVIKIEDSDNTSDFALESVRIKPWNITYLDIDDNYVIYNGDNDRWGFGNTPEGVWPQSWWSGFDYQNGTDPFTGQTYPASSMVFSRSISSRFPDWVSFVNTFGTDAAYTNLAMGVYSPSAVNYWQSIKQPWGGSCFGIAIANALAYMFQDSFFIRFSDFTMFNHPISVTGDETTYPVITELFTHQFGNPNQESWSVNVQKSPAQTIEEMKSMFEQDNTQIRTLSFMNNGSGGGGHSILAYKLRQDPDQENIYYVGVYDNSFPDVTDAEILVDVDANGGSGTWAPLYGWNGWGGTHSFALEDRATSFLATAAIPSKIVPASPFILSDTQLKVFQHDIGNLLIKNEEGQLLGFSGDTLSLDIQGAYPVIVKNGSKGPPLGYNLPFDNYHIELSGFSNDSTSLSLFSGNKQLSLHRYDASETQMDHVFYDGGISIVNHDPESKSYMLTNINNEETQEKVFLVQNLSLSPGDSVKFLNPDDSSLNLVNYGSATSYEIELELATSSGQGRLVSNLITLDAGTTHLMTSSWETGPYLDLTVYVDNGNDGTIEDTLSVVNLLTSIETDPGTTIPSDYQLAQNYPNPFNSSTIITYSIPSQQRVVLKVYNLLGQEVAALVDDVKAAGTHTATFDASGLSSGVYMYKLVTGSFSSTKKMLLAK